MIQYLSQSEFARLLTLCRQKLKPDGCLVLGDVIPRDVAPWRDAIELVKLAGAHGFLFSAAAGLVKSYFSDYLRIRREAGFLQFDEAEIVQELRLAGFAAERHGRNIGHNTARMTFRAVVRRDEEIASDAQPREVDGDHRCPTPPRRPQDRCNARSHRTATRRGSGVRPCGLPLCRVCVRGGLAALAFPWLSGAVTIPYDAKALFQAQLQFLANAFHSGQSPYWNPSTFVGVPQISDPQSLLFSPAVLLAYLEKVPSFWQLDAFVLALLGVGGVAILKLCQDRGWHPGAGVVAAIAFAFGASAAWRIQHIAQIQSLAFFARDAVAACAGAREVVGALRCIGRACRGTDDGRAQPGRVPGLLRVGRLLAATIGCLAPDRGSAVRKSMRPWACGVVGAVVASTAPAS